MHRNKAFHDLIISFCVSLRSYMLDTVAIFVATMSGPSPWLGVN